LNFSTAQRLLVSCQQHPSTWLIQAHLSDKVEVLAPNGTSCVALSHHGDAEERKLKVLNLREVSTFFSIVKGIQFIFWKN
jgi:hypothetical protein